MRLKLIFFLILGVAIIGFIPKAFAATMYFSPSSGSYSANKTFTVGIYTTSPDKALNAIQGIVNFPNDKLEVISVSRSDSILTLWVQEPIYSNAYGTIQWAGVVPNPGFTGRGGRIISIVFKVKESGLVNLIITKGSILANDGEGTQILEEVGDANFSLLPSIPGLTAPEAITPIEAKGTPFAPVISSPTHPDPEQWYNNSIPLFKWPVPGDITAARILYNKLPVFQPTVVYSPAITEKQLENIEDGIWYFHAQLKNKNGWGSISRFRFQIDTKPPEPFSIKFVGDKETENPQPQIIFGTTDSLSGIDYYRIKIGEGNFFIVKPEEIDGNPYTLPIQLPGRHSLWVQAFDKAGNPKTATEEFYIKPLEAPTITDYPQELNEGDVLIIKGSTYPQSIVKIYLQKDDSVKIDYQEIRSNGSGDFSLIWGKKLSGEIYKFWADVTNEEGAKSNPTDTYVFVVKETALSGIGSFILKYLTAFLGLAVLIIGIITFFWIVWRQLKKRLLKEVVEAEKVLHQSFLSLRENISKHVRTLEKAELERPLTKEENKIINLLRKDLDAAEKVIGKEIKDIEKQV